MLLGYPLSKLCYCIYNQLTWTLTTKVFIPVINVWTRVRQLTQSMPVKFLLRETYNDLALLLADQISFFCSFPSARIEKTIMKYTSSIMLACSGDIASAFVGPHNLPRTNFREAMKTASDSSAITTRKEVLQHIFGAAGFLATSVTFMPSSASADVSSGTALPQGAAQFNRVVRVKSDLTVRTKAVPCYWLLHPSKHCNRSSC